MKRKSKLPNLRIRKYNEGGFALPVVLAVGAIAAATLVTLAFMSQKENSRTRFSLLGFLAKNELGRSVSTLRSVIDDNQNFFYYYLLARSCGDSRGMDSSCSSVRVEEPSESFWNDAEYCLNSTGSSIACRGRKKAPMCDYNRSVDWSKHTQTWRELIGANPGKTNSIQAHNTSGSYVISSFMPNSDSDPFGDTNYTNKKATLVLNSEIRGSKGEGKATDRSVAELEYQPVLPEAGYGYIAAGTYFKEARDSLWLGNLRTSGKGSLVWRADATSSYDCTSAKAQTGSTGSLPSQGSGGLWMQAIGLPKTNLSSAVPVSGGTPSIICWRRSSSCSVIRSSIALREIVIAGDAQLRIETSDSNPVVVKVAGSMYVGPNASICHVNQGSGQCGSGKPKNLTIISEEMSESDVAASRLVCNKDNNNSGFRMAGTRTSQSDQADDRTITLYSTGGVLPARFIGSDLSIAMKQQRGRYVPYYPSRVNYGAGFSYQRLCGYRFEPYRFWTWYGWRTYYRYVYRCDYRYVYNPGTYEEPPILTETNGLYGAIYNGSSNITRLTDVRTQDYISGDSLSRNGYTPLAIGKARLASDYVKTALLTQDTRGNLAIRPIVNNVVQTSSFGIGVYDAYRRFGIRLTSLSGAANQRTINGLAWVRHLCVDSQGSNQWTFNKDVFDQTIKPWGVAYLRTRGLSLWDKARQLGF